MTRIRGLRVMWRCSTNFHTQNVSDTSTILSPQQHDFSCLRQFRLSDFFIWHFLRLLGPDHEA